MEKQEIDVQENLLLIRGEYREKFEAFRAYLLEFNGRYNLTAITEEKDVLYKHFVDSAAARGLFSNGASVAEIGSGAGFPGAGDAGGDQFLDRIAGFCHFVPVCPEGIGIDDVRTHGDELFLCINDAFRFCDVVDFRQCADRHTAFLQHGTHAAVQTNEFAVRK